MTDYDAAQRAVLHADIPRVREVLRVLTDDGLASRLGDRVGASRAAVRFDAVNQPG
jgi:hypothetical protein